MARISGRTFGVSVIIPTRNRSATLGRCLSHLTPQLTPHDEVIVVDNGSSDDSADVVGRFARRYRIRYCFDPVRGASHARNTGIARATRPGIAFIDDDSMVAEGWLKTVRRILVSRKSSHPDAVYQGGISQRYASDGVWESRRLTDYATRVVPLGLGEGVRLFDRIRYLVVCNVFTYRSTMNRLPGLPFDALNFPFIGEDPELAYRLVRSGFPIFAAPTAAVVHDKPAMHLRVLLRMGYLYGRAESMLARMYFGDAEFLMSFGAVPVVRQSRPMGSAPSRDRSGIASRFLEFVYDVALTSSNLVGKAVGRFIPIRNVTGRRT